MVVSVVDDEGEEIEKAARANVVVPTKMVRAHRYGNAVPKQPVERIAATNSTFFEVAIAA